VKWNVTFAAILIVFLLSVSTSLKYFFDKNRLLSIAEKILQLFKVEAVSMKEILYPRLHLNDNIYSYIYLSTL
jgi:hypothetical protein